VEPAFRIMDWVMLQNCPSPGIVLDRQVREGEFHYRMDWPDHAKDHRYYPQSDLLPWRIAMQDDERSRS